MTLYQRIKQWHDTRPKWVRTTVLYPIAGSAVGLLYLSVALASLVGVAALLGPYAVLGVGALLLFWSVLAIWIIAAIVAELDL